MEKKYFAPDASERFDLISIGELSKLTGVNIKSLRYYEKIDVLHPAYVNPDSGYRYYTHSQVQLVIAIQFYVDLGIPLNTLHNFMDSETQSVNFGEQISYGVEVARQRLMTLKEQIRHSEYLLSEISRCDKLVVAKEPVQYELPEKNCWVIQVQGAITEQKYYSVLHRLLADMHKAGIKTGGDTGILLLREDDLQKQFVFVDVKNIENTSAERDTHYLHIEKRNYFCRATPFIILKEEELEGCAVKPEVVILTELFSSSFDYRKPEFELRWSFA